MGPGDLVVPTVPAGARSGLTIGSMTALELRVLLDGEPDERGDASVKEEPHGGGRSQPELRCRGAPVGALRCWWTGRPEWRTLPGAAIHRETGVVTCPSTS